LIGQVYVKEYLPKGPRKITEIGNAIRDVYAKGLKPGLVSPETKEKAWLS